LKYGFIISANFLKINFNIVVNIGTSFRLESDKLNKLINTKI